MMYDSAGNQTYDCVGTHFYDAENRMTKAVQGSSNNYYFYDGNGKRVRRILNGSQTWGGQETWFVYGFEGELAAEVIIDRDDAVNDGDDDQVAQRRRSEPGGLEDIELPNEAAVEGIPARLSRKIAGGKLSAGASRSSLRASMPMRHIWAGS